MLLTRNDLAKIYKYMNREERHKLANAWGVTLANCTRYCTKPYSTRIPNNRWAKMITIWPVDTWKARLDEALRLNEIAEVGSMEDADVIQIDVTIPDGVPFTVVVNGRELR